MEVLSVLLVGSIVTYLMYQNINKVTASLEVDKGSSFESYAIFASSISEHIRKVKNDLDKDIESTYPRFNPHKECDEQQSVKKLLDLLRKTALYETVMAKRKAPKDIEKELGSILSEFDAIIRESCVEGDMLADDVKNALYKEYKKIHR